MMFEHQKSIPAVHFKAVMIFFRCKKELQSQVEVVRCPMAVPQALPLWNHQLWQLSLNPPHLCPHRKC